MIFILVILSVILRADDVEVRPMTRVRKVAGLPKVARADVARVMLDASMLRPPR